MSKTARREMLALAARLARHERFDTTWIDYPEWAGMPPGGGEPLETAGKYRKWATAILAGDLPAPA